MKKLLISILTIGVVSAVAVGVTRAFFSSQDVLGGNTINTETLEISLDGSGSAYTHHMNFPLTLAPGENTSWIEPNGGTRGLRFGIDIEPGSMIPDHFEIHFSTSNFRDGLVDGHGSASNRNQYTRAIEVTHLRNYTDGWVDHGLLGQIDDSQDGNTGFLSLYDLERTILDDVVVGDTLNGVDFTLRMADDAGNKFQGDSLDLAVTVGAAQVAGQDVL